MSEIQEQLISADSHVIERHDLWEQRLPPSLRERAPRYPEQSIFQAHEGGWDPVARVKEMAVDGVSGEVLYPSLALNQFGLTDAALQEACFRVYNDWLIEYCTSAPERLFGIALISTYDIDQAVRELTRGKQAGLRGALIWQVPPDELSFVTGHYDRFWAAAQELEMPISLHILTGLPYGPGEFPGMEPAPEFIRFAVNSKLLHVTNALSDLICSGVLERFPRLKFVLVENEVSWLPFVLSQIDKYYSRPALASTLPMPPSDYFRRQVFATFFNDPPTRWLLGEWGSGNCLWSNDFPHLNSTWPDSREVIARDLGHLPAATRRRLVYDNVVELYDLRSVPPLDSQARLPSQAV